MYIFIAIAVASFLVLAVSFIFGGHDHDHDFGGHDHDASHDHDSGHGGGESTISIFSTKVIFTFTMVFGGVGSIAMYYKQTVMVASIYGALSGVVMALLMWLLLRLIYSQQATTVINTAKAKGLNAIVTTSIPANAQGMIEVTVEGRLIALFARSTPETTAEIHKGSVVTVVEANNSSAVVKLIPSEDKVLDEVK